MEVIFSDWIDKKIESIKNDDSFKYYFEGEEISTIEDSCYLTSDEHGIEIVMDFEQIIQSIHFFSGQNKQHSCFLGDLPLGIKFSDYRSDIINKIGNPDKSGGGESDFFFGDIPLWDKYYFLNYSLHIQFQKNGTSIEIVTLGSLNLE